MLGLVCAEFDLKTLTAKIKVTKNVIVYNTNAVIVILDRK